MASAAQTMTRFRGIAPPRWVLRALSALIPVVLIAIAARAMHHELRTLKLGELHRVLAAMPRGRIALGVGLVAVNYLCLTLYDVLALRHLGVKLPYRKVGLTSFVATAFGHNIGFAALSAGSVRLRLYTGFGLSASQVTRVVIFCALTFWCGVFGTGAVAFIAHPQGVLGLAPWAVRSIGVAFAAVALAYLGASRFTSGHLRLGPLSMTLPPTPTALAQFAVAMIDWLLAATVFAVLLPASAQVPARTVVALFLAAQVAGLVSQVPGGLGVFEAVILASLRGHVPAAGLVGALVVYRCLYYLLPFVAAIGLLAGTELARRHRRLFAIASDPHAPIAAVVPMFAAAAAFAGGVVLLASAATPAKVERLAALRDLVPLTIVEASHFLSSLVAAALLLIARGLYRRLDGAWVMAIGLFALGALLSLAKGIDFEEAGLLLLFSLALLPFRGQFYRRTSLLGERFGARWVLGIAAVVLGAGWVAHFAYAYTQYDSDLWWRFTFEGDAPRSLRAAVGALGGLALFGLVHLLRPPRVKVAAPDGDALAAARTIVELAPDSSAHLALTGDKALLFNEARTAFVMYGVEGESWVSMGDPVGPPEEATELAWRFHALADAHGGNTCFYQVRADTLPRYLDLGLALLKLGEEAVIPLADFSLEGPQRRALRTGYRRAQKEGLTFELVPQSGLTSELFAELRRISDAWLAAKGAREKGFSLGAFDERYLREGPIALARCGGRLEAFANVWTSAAREELSVDLMRFTTAAPPAAMEFLFVSLMLWGQEQGYRSFSLGMAPFSGLQARALAPLWNRLGALVFRHGEHFYNFQGLRQYKEKFKPQWRPRYLAAPSGLALPVVLTHIAALVSRGRKGAG